MNRPVVRKLRCAVYTRKSSEEGLEQEFNSLHAQREACESYIASQRSEGWVLVRDQYDDGGISGGTLDRPALKQLLADIEDGLVDVVVVYKIDRLSRSLMDFSKLVEVFDRNGVTFVSVTQSFNTTTSMGRLTLNILLSFAQFEREVTAERIRDKIRASRQKGMWMGGIVPLGYRVENRKLVIEESEATTVRMIFVRFVAIGSATVLAKTLAAENVRTRSGKLIDKGFLYKLLNNRVYIGEAVHKGESYPGEHEAIIDRSLWDKVHAILQTSPRKRASNTRAQTPALLKGLIFGPDGAAFSPTHTKKGDKLYRYYVSQSVLKRGAGACPIVETFDAHQVSFVSVTQAFNTTTSMGRLTLNVLLSFAQFEREVTAERIRDKIAASKKKGMWMGGRVPLGYDVIERQLVVNASEAETVRSLFRLYLECGTVRALQERANALGLVTKLRQQRSGAISGGGPFSRGHLYHLLSNPIYIGRVPHRGTSYPGRHPPLVDEATWNAVQAHMARRPTGSDARRPSAPSMLAGLIYDETGDRLSPSHASKGGRRYRYYISQRLMRNPRSDGDGWRLPAHELERAVIAVVAGFLQDEPRLMTGLQLDHASAVELRRLFNQAAQLGTRLTDEPRDLQEWLGSFVTQVEVAPGRLTVTLDRHRLRAILRCSDDTPDQRQAESTLALTADFMLRRRGVEARLVLGDPSAQPSTRDPRLVTVIANAHSWFEELVEGPGVSIRTLAERNRIDGSDATRIVQLAFLAPDIVEAILKGAQPIGLTAKRLKRLGRLPHSWVEQRRALGFASAERR